MTSFPSDIETDTSFSVLAASQECPQKIALISHGMPVSFDVLAAQVSSAIDMIQSLSLPTSAMVALLCTQEQKTYTLMYALIELGIPVVLIHPRLTKVEQHAIVSDSGAVYFFDEGWILPKDEHPATLPKSSTSIDSQTPLCIIYTSGTTGKSKGAVLSRDAFLAAAKASAHNLGWLPEDRWLLCMPVSHVGGLSILLRCLQSRTPVVLMDESTSSGFSSAQICFQIERDRVTILSLVPTMLKRLLDENPDWIPPKHLRVVLLGGAAANAALLERAAARNIPVLMSYGLTEACSQVTTEMYGKDYVAPRGVGFPVQGMQVRIVAQEIWIQGPSLLTGYLSSGMIQRPDLKDGWFSTGDLGFFDQHGQLHILNRRIDLIISGGENIYPSEIEKALEAQDGIFSACVFGIPDEYWGQSVAVAIVAKPGTNIHLQIGKLRNRMAGYKIPRYAAMLPEFPTSSHGKMDRMTVIKTATPLLFPILT